MNGILIIAHSPLASALRACALHVFPDCGAGVQAVDVPPQEDPQDTLARAQEALRLIGTDQVLVLSDVLGATPCNVAQQLAQTANARLLVGANVPMLLRSVCYRHESLDELAKRAQAGGTQGIASLSCVASEPPTGVTPHATSDHHRH